MEVLPDTATVGSSGTLALRGTNFSPGVSISTPHGLDLRNIEVKSASLITADYTVASDAWLGILNVRVTTPAGTSEPATIKIVPGTYQFGLPGPWRPQAARETEPEYERFDVGIHAAPVANPDGSYTDAYLDVSFTDDKGRPVAVVPSWHSDMDNVMSPEDPGPPPNVTSYSLAVENPATGDYVLHIKSSRIGSLILEADTSTSSSQESLAALENIPTYAGSSFELHFVCRRDPFSVDIESGGLQPPHGAFSFAQPLTPDVQLPAEATALGVVIYYDPVMEPSSFLASLDGADVTRMFHVRLGEIEFVSVPLVPGKHNLTIRANNKSGASTEQVFHIQH